MKNMAREMNKELVRSALVAIAERNNGYLDPAKVVESAEDPESPLHDRFEWDDTEAAAHFRNIQAGVLIRMIKITVVQAPKETGAEVTITTTRGFQSLPSDRKPAPTEEKGSYQPIPEIMSAPAKREELLATVLKELEAYRKRYSNIAELAGVWKALDKVVKAH